ncbi:MAG TPA: (2Fe-2S)-binding protein [Terriglobales bacterium]|nr:(2Fe-2S)-binding protein [Terriglobales bacterium]
MRDEDVKITETGTPESGVSRRDFLKIGSLTVAVPVVMGPPVVEAAGQDVAVYGPGKAPVTLTVNGKKLTAELEPRTTLLDALRDHFDLTGSKRVCDRAECGACTVLVDGRAVYACQMLAIDAQAHEITTIESLVAQEGAGATGGAVSSQGWKLHPIQQAFVDHDAQQCGFCTPGFVMAAKAVLDKNPRPTPEQVIDGLSGNLCRCGTYTGLKAALASVAQGTSGPKEGA